MKSRLFTLLLVTFFISTELFAQAAVPPLGSGTEEDPYLIANLDNLHWLTLSSAELDKYYVQTANIDASSTSGWHSGAGFGTIGVLNEGFTGHYDGGGYKITGLYINRPTADYVGLFGYAAGATITNVHLEDVNIRGNDYVGALVGVTGQQTTVSKSSSSGEVKNASSGWWTGGLVGRNNFSYISESYSSATVTGTKYVGGLTGESYGNYATVTNSYAIGAVTGNENVGGLTGQIFEGNISDSYAIGSVTGNIAVGGFVGKVFNPGTVTNVYWNTETGGPDNGYGTGLTTAQMRQKASFTGFDFTETWTIYEEASYPGLLNNTESPFIGLEFDGDGTSGSPYQISTVGQLNAIRDNRNAHYILTADIDLTTATRDGGILWNEGKGWKPIGSTYSDAFTGKFNGNGYTINGLFINRSGENGIGLFGFARNGTTIENVGLTNVDITGGILVGGIVADLNYNPSIITNSFVIGSVKGTQYVGGIAGRVTSAKLENSYSEVTTGSGGTIVGGIAGVTDGSSKITNTYTFGSPSGSSKVGAIIGENVNSTITNGYWNTETTELNVAVGSGNLSNSKGLTSSEMRQEASYIGFDFTNTWEFINEFSFPVLQNVTPDSLPGFLAEDISGRSLSLDGIDDFIDIPDKVATVLGNNSNLTMEAWIKPDYINQTQSLASLFSINTNFGFNTILITIDNATSELAGKIRVLDGTNNQNNYDIVSPKLTNNEWVHIAYTLNGITGTLYFNGEKIGQHTQTRALATTDYWSFGQEYDAGKSKGNFAKVVVDELRIWNDARTQDEIRTNMFQKLNGDESGLVYYLPLDETVATSASNKSSRVNDDTIIVGNAEWVSETHPYGTVITGNEGWRMMSVPVSGVSYGEILDTLWTQGFTGADKTNGNSNVLVWDESSKAFNSISNATDMPAAGSGFITYVYDDDNYDDSPDGFPKVIRTDSTQYSGTISPTLTFTDSGNLASDGWNLVGNPYGATIDWDASSGMTSTNLDASFYVWSDSASGGTGAYLSWNGSTGTFGGGEIAPWQGFWVKANATSPSLSLNDEIRSGGGILRKQASISQLDFTLTDDAMSSQTIVMFDERAEVTKDGLDAYKLQSLNAEYLSLFTKLEEGSALDINALPKTIEAPISIPLDFASHDVGGEYTLSWNPSYLPEGMTLTLIDNEAKTETDLTKASSYSFEIESEANEKAVKTQEIASPQHGVISPTVMKAKATGSRFTIQINSKTSVGNEQIANLPQSVELQQNYPNPFNPSTTISYQLPTNGKVQLQVFDMLGRQVAELVNGQVEAGYHQVNFDARNLASGMYIYRLQAGNSVITKKLTLIK